MVSSPTHIQTGGGNGARGGVDPSDASPKSARPSKAPIRRSRSIISTDQPGQAPLQHHSSQNNLQHSNRLTTGSGTQAGVGSAPESGELVIGGGRTGSAVSLAIQRWVGGWVRARRAIC